MPEDRPVSPAKVLVIVAGAALVAAMAYRLAPPMGIDLAAQAERAGFVARHGAAAIDFGWYGGTSPFGYSLLTPAMMAALGAGTAGARLLGALAAVVAALLLTLLFLRTRAVRPLWGGLFGVCAMVGNIVSGRVTFTAGLVFGLAAMLALTCPKPWHRYAGGAVAALLSAATSPVAGLFVGLAGAAVMLAEWLPNRPAPEPGRPAPEPNRPAREPGRPATRRGFSGLVVAFAAAVPTIGLGELFGAGGPMNTIPSDTLRSFTVSLLVAALVPLRTVRIGALLSAAGVLAASLLSTPVGLNAGRLSASFALATLAAYVVVPHRIRPVARPAALLVLLGVVAVWQHPVAVSDLRTVNDPTSEPAYFQPLIQELSRGRPAGRIEVVPTLDYWEAAYLPETVPLARGWLRQAENPIFLDSRLTSATYEAWLRDNGVALVALADAPPASVARHEARLVRTNPPYLHRIWRGGHWTLYEVVGNPSIVTGATLVSSTAGGVAVDVTTPGDALIRVRWSRWLALDGPAGCLAPGPNGWTTLRTRSPGRYELTGRLKRGPAC